MVRPASVNTLDLESSPIDVIAAVYTRKMALHIAI